MLIGFQCVNHRRILKVRYSWLKLIGSDNFRHPHSLCSDWVISHKWAEQSFGGTCGLGGGGSWQPAKSKKKQQKLHSEDRKHNKHTNVLTFIHWKIL